jgi:hypothetical protein
MSDSNPWVGSWTYRSLLNDPNQKTAFNDLQFGLGEIKIKETEFDTMGGTIGGTIGGTWSLKLHGSIAYGSPMQARFQGKGINGGFEWIYDYIAWLVPAWPNSDSNLQRTAMVGSVVRTIPHPGLSGTGPMHPAGVVASFYAVRVK